MLWFLAIMLVYTAGWLRYTARSARVMAAAAELPWTYCHANGGRRTEFRSICRDWHGTRCWHGDASSGNVSPSLVRYAALRALWWPVQSGFRARLLARRSTVKCKCSRSEHRRA